MNETISMAGAGKAAGDAAVTASSESMSFAVGEKRATLTVAVVVTSQDRATSGDTLELDEEAGTAVLTGSPARSVKGADVLQGNRLLYYLDSDDVVVMGNVTGEIELELDEQ